MFRKIISLGLLSASTIVFSLLWASAAAANTTKAIEAGPIWNQSDANTKCPRLAQQEGGTWTGQWWTTVPSQMSVCQIEFKSTTGTKTFSVLNYNVMFLSSSLYPNHKQDYRANQIPTAIKNAGQWDIIVINEAFDNGSRGKLQRNLKNVGYPFNTEVVDANNGKPEDGGVYIQSRWPILETGKLVFSDCSGIDCQSNKGAIYAKINKEGQIYHTFGTHLQADAENTNVRNNQLRQLQNFVKQKTVEAKSKGEAVIIAGDLNFNLNTSEYHNALNTINAKFFGTAPEDYTFDPLTNDLAKYRYKGQAREWLDYVLISNEGIQPVSTNLNVMKFRTSSAYEIPGSGDFFNLFGGTMVKDLSDHYGLSANYMF